ncbi:hypothetical protein LA327_08140 [Thomasclavelia ramosa]|uniref:hypothetical protein n=1 Tax=Thomasclavelia ramosa TaxID=1547 RepID=UPI00024A57B3|nr:hypothetical protein [Thomasclavelia ramosa]EHQ47243.1 hypothetical protein HMPREF0978_01548 [Coprobacillus sp. 8_2_54BFAA]UBH46019.1 hypothetical protein LA327_08140 [Thomasclavelia ramosa]
MKWVKEYIRKRRIEKWKKEVEKIAVVTAACSNMKFKFFNCDLNLTDSKKNRIYIELLIEKSCHMLYIQIKTVL